MNNCSENNNDLYQKALEKIERDKKCKPACVFLSRIRATGPAA